MPAMKTWIRCLSVFATVCLQLKITAAESLEIKTEVCTRFIGGSVEILGRYMSTPGGPVDWKRPDLKSIGICTPNGSCGVPLTGYSISQSASGLEYTLLMSAARGVDEGLWQLLDGVTPLSTSLTFTANLSAINVSCSVTNTSNGYTESVTCTTECVDDALNVSYTFQTGLLTPSTNATSCASGAQYSSTVTFDSSYPGGSHELCPVLFNGHCNRTQTDWCPYVVTPYPQGYQRAFVGLACVLLLLSALFLAVVIKRRRTDPRRNVVIGMLIATHGLAVLAIIVLITYLTVTGCDSECRNLHNSNFAGQLGIAGIVFTVLGLIAFIVAVIIYYGMATQEDY